MKLEVSAEGMGADAEKIILSDITSVIFDYRTEKGLKRILKVKEVK